MNFTPATPAKVEKITITIIGERLIVSHSWTHPDDRAIRKGVLAAKYDLQQTYGSPGLSYSVKGTQSDLERLDVELDAAYGLAHNA